VYPWGPSGILRCVMIGFRRLDRDRKLGKEALGDDVEDGVLEVLLLVAVLALLLRRASCSISG